jgi:sec-independent protein translocase protein TatC
MATSGIDQQNLLSSPSDPEDEDELSAMSLIEHLEELRWRIFKILIGIAIGTIIAFIFQHQIIEFLTRPLPANSSVIAKISGGDKLDVTGLGEGFTSILLVSVVAGAIASLPWTLYQVWAFIAPGLYSHEKKHAGPFIVLGIFLFALGISIGYIVLQYPVQWLVNFGSTSFAELVSAGSYFSFVAIFLLVFGIIFELPLVLTFLAMVGIVSRETLASKRAVIHIGFWVASTVVTPGADLYSPIFIGVSLSVLFEFSLILIRFVVKNQPEEIEA